LITLAIKFDEMIRAGEVRDYADLARFGHLSRPRITQIMNSLNLAPQIQEASLLPNAGPNLRLPITERGLRQVARSVAWEDQILRFQP
jgi:hypothetical protein